MTDVGINAPTDLVHGNYTNFATIQVITTAVPCVESFFDFQFSNQALNFLIILRQP